MNDRLIQNPAYSAAPFQLLVLSLLFLSMLFVRNKFVLDPTTIREA